MSLFWATGGKDIRKFWVSLSQWLVLCCHVCQRIWVLVMDFMEIVQVPHHEWVWFSWTLGGKLRIHARRFPHLTER